MRRNRWSTFALALILGVVAAATTPAWSTEEGTLGLALDAAGEITSLHVALPSANAVVTVPIFVIANHIQGGIRAIEFAIDFTPNTSWPSYEVSDGFEGPFCPEFWHQWVCLYSNGCFAASSQEVLATFLYQVYSTTEPGLRRLCIVPLTPSSVDPAAPAYLQCGDSSGALALPLSSPGCIELTIGEPVAVGSVSWGRLRALYD